MRKSMRIIAVGIVLVLCLMLTCVAVNLTVVLGRDGFLGGDQFLMAEEPIPLLARAWIVCLCVTAGLTAAAWTLTAPQVKLHMAALAILAPCAVMIALCKPALGWYSWDEETHYLLMQAFLGADGSTLGEHVAAVSVWDLGYLPTIAGMALGRLFRAGDVMEYKLGALVCGLVYAGMCSLAVKHAPKYKVTFLAVAAIPVSQFLAGSCTYDAMVIASILLGMSILLETCMQPGPMSGLRALAMTALLSLGTMAKPAYSLLLLLLLLIPGEKLGSRGRAWAWRGFVVLLTIWSLLSLMMPGTYDNVREGDSRFSGADSRAQLAFVLADPRGALSILWRYIRTAWQGLHLSDLTHWAYLGLNANLNRVIGFGILLACPLCVCGEDDRRSPLTAWRRICFYGMEVLVLLVLVVTQFMVSTPVGGEVIQGMQSRYSVPVWILLALSLMYPEKLRRLAAPAGRPLTCAVVLASAVLAFWCAGYNLLGVIGGLA